MIKIYANKSGAYPVDPYAAQIIGEDCAPPLCARSDVAAPKFRPCANVRQNRGRGRQTDRGRKRRCDNGARNKRLLAAFFKDKAQIAEAAKPNLTQNTPFS